MIWKVCYISRDVHELLTHETQTFNPQHQTAPFIQSLQTKPSTTKTDVRLKCIVNI